MSRGQYAPLDRDRHWVVGWGTEVARDYATARAIAPVVPAIEVASTIDRGARGARQILVGSQAFRDRGETPVAQVGAEWFHSVGDRDRAIAQLSTEWQQLAADLDGDPAHHADPAWVKADIAPAIEEWNHFVSRETSSWWTRAATDWQVFEDWQERIKRLRELARARGIVLASPEPHPLPKTVWQRGAEGKGSEPAAWLGILKLGFYAALTLTGAFALYGAVSALRGNKDR